MSLDRFQIFCPNKHSDVQLGQHTDRTFQVQIQVKMTMMRMKLVMRIMLMMMMAMTKMIMRVKHTKPTFEVQINTSMNTPYIQLKLFNTIKEHDKNGHTFKFATKCC